MKATYLLTFFIFIIFNIILKTSIPSYGNSVQNFNDPDPMQNTSIEIMKEIFGTIDGREVYLFTLKNSEGMIVRITNFGGIVTSIITPDKTGKFDDVVLGFDSLQPYLSNPAYFGGIIGRYANRIANGVFTLNGTEYKLAANNGPNHLHGGIRGFDKVIWDYETIKSDTVVSLKLTYLSPDMEEGYPGNLKAEVIYTLNEKNELKIQYKATTDKATPVNLTNHSYFSLSGAELNRHIMFHSMMIRADQYTVVNENLIPTGEQRDVTGTPFDFRNPQTIGSRFGETNGGYDHNFVLSNPGKFRKVATVSDVLSGRVLDVFTDQPGIQFYSGNFLDGSIIGKGGKSYRKYNGFCLETQHFPDSPNQKDFPDTILKPGETYKTTTTYKFSVSK